MEYEIVAVTLAGEFSLLLFVVRKLFDIDHKLADMAGRFKSVETLILYDEKGRRKQAKL